MNIDIDQARFVALILSDLLHQELSYLNKKAYDQRIKFNNKDVFIEGSMEADAP